MRRRRSALTAWPAFTDLMTVLAVLGFAMAAHSASTNKEEQENERAAQKSIQENERLQGRIRTLEGQLAAARERIRELENQLAEEILGTVSCLGVRPGSTTAAIPLVRIWVDGAEYRLEDVGADAAGVPGLGQAINRSPLPVADFQRYADAILEHGDARNPSCRFFVVLRKGRNTSQAEFARALGVVNEYFLPSNPKEVNRLLREEG